MSDSVADFVDQKIKTSGGRWLKIRCGGNVDEIDFAGICNELEARSYDVAGVFSDASGNYAIVARRK